MESNGAKNWMKKLFFALAAVVVLAVVLLVGPAEVATTAKGVLSNFGVGNKKALASTPTTLGAPEPEVTPLSTLRPNTGQSQQAENSQAENSDGLAKAQTPTPTATHTPKPTETPRPTATATEEAPSPVESYKAFNELMDQEFENLKKGKTFRLKGIGTTTIYKQAGHFVENILTAMLEDATGKKFPAGIISVIADEEWGPKLQPVLVGPLHAVVIQKYPMEMEKPPSYKPFARKVPPFIWYMSTEGFIDSRVQGLEELANVEGGGGDLAGSKVTRGIYKNFINRYAKNKFDIFFFTPKANGDFVVYEYKVKTDAVVNSMFYDATIRATGKFRLGRKTLDKLRALDPNNPEDYKEIQNLLLAQGISFPDKKALKAFFKAEVETYAASGGVR